MYHYQYAFTEHLISLGLKGIFLGFKNILKIEKDKKKKLLDHLRAPRAFYGRFQTIREYDLTHASIYKKIRMMFYFTNVMRVNNFYFIFSTHSMLQYNLNFICTASVDYVHIKEVTVKKNNISIKFSHAVDNQESWEYSCLNESQAREMMAMINLEKKRNEDEINNL